MGYSEQRIPRPNAGTPRGMGDYDPPEEEPDVAECLRCGETGYARYAVVRAHGHVCNRCDEEYDLCASGESPECWEGWVDKDELTYVGTRPMCRACVAEEEQHGGD
jgi:formylmethanofuran dehydrogenase subunit E